MSLLVSSVQNREGEGISPSTGETEKRVGRSFVVLTEWTNWSNSDIDSSVRCHDRVVEERTRRTDVLRVKRRRWDLQRTEPTL